MEGMKFNGTRRAVQHPMLRKEVSVQPTPMSSTSGFRVRNIVVILTYWLLQRNVLHHNHHDYFCKFFSPNCDVNIELMSYKLQAW